MTTARNFAAQAERGLMRAADNKSTILSEDDRKTFRMISMLIRDSHHFLVPDGGKIMDDRLKGLEGCEPLHLPFDVITLEYYDNAPGFCEQVVTLACQVTFGEAERYVGRGFTKTSNASTDENCILVYNAVEVNDAIHGKVWLLRPWVSVIRNNALGLKDGSFHLYTVQICESMVNHLTEEEKADYESYDQFYVHALLELLEALSCRNVTTVNCQEESPKNAKRIKAGKLPIYETKMLVVDTKSSVGGKGAYQGASHSSPRQHLRRGHIRRHPTAGNIWVQSCVVGDSGNGTIHKQYFVK